MRDKPRMPARADMKAIAAEVGVSLEPWQLGWFPNPSQKRRPPVPQILYVEFDGVGQHQAGCECGAECKGTNAAEVSHWVKNHVAYCPLHR